MDASGSHATCTFVGRLVTVHGGSGQGCTPLVGGTLRRMDEETVHAESRRASQLVEAGEPDQALEVLDALVHSDIEPFNRAVMCVNMATIHRRQGDVAAARWRMDQAVALEQPTGQRWAAQMRAVFLHETGHTSDAIDALVELLDDPDLPEGDRERVRANLDALRPDPTD